MSINDVYHGGCDRQIHYHYVQHNLNGSFVGPLFAVNATWPGAC